MGQRGHRESQYNSVSFLSILVPTTLYKAVCGRYCIEAGLLTTTTVLLNPPGGTRRNSVYTMNLRLLFLSFLLWETVEAVLRQVLAYVTAHQKFHAIVPDAEGRETLAKQGPSYLKSTIHATILAARGLRHLILLWNAPMMAKMQLLDGELGRQVYAGRPHVWDESLAVVVSNTILAGYLASDLLHVVLQFPKLGGVDTAVHHAIFLTCAWIAGQSRAMPFCFSWLIIGEASTPLLNARWACIKAKRTDGVLFDVVQKAFALVFVLTRFFMYGVGLVHLLYMFVQVGDKVPTAKWVQWVNLVLVAGRFLLNLVWLKKIFGVISRSRRRNEQKTQ